MMGIFHLLFAFFSPLLSHHCQSSFLDQTANHGRAHGSPDRTNDHHRGQRRQPAGSSGAVVIWKSTSAKLSY